MSEPVKLYNVEAAAHAGVAVSTWRDYCNPRGGKPRRGPAPDGVDVEKGHARPWWKPETVDAWKASRPGQGARTDLHKDDAG